MSNEVPQRFKSEAGYTLMELLVVVLIVGLLAAIAIPSFLNQTSKAKDAAAKTLVRAAETAAETYSADHNGEYTGMSPAELKKIEPSLNATSPAKLEVAAAKEGGGYEVEAGSVTSGEKFKIERTGGGAIRRTCTVPLKEEKSKAENRGGCPPSGEW